MSPVELPACPVCRENYSRVVPLVLKCGHTICRDCVKTFIRENNNKKELAVCPICRQSNVMVNLSKNFTLEEAMDVIKKLGKNKHPPKDSMKCTGCEKIECESDLFICRDCLKSSIKYENKSSGSSQTSSNPELFAICGSCAIRVHLSAGHKTVSYFSVSSPFQFKTLETGVNLQREELEQRVADFDKNYSSLKQTVRRTYKEIDKMTELMQKSKSSKIQREFARRINKEVNKIAAYVNSVTGCISAGNTNYRAEFNHLVAKNLQDEEENCQEIQEETTEFVCTSCDSEQTQDRMMCCRKCSEVVELLMTDKIDASNFDVVDTSTLPICTQCVFTKHFGGDHNVVKLDDVLEKYQIAEEVTRLSENEAEIKENFGALVKASQQYITQVQYYNNRITDISKMSEATRGLPQHATIMARLDQCLEEADQIINSLQEHAEFEEKILKDAVNQGTEAVRQCCVLREQNQMRAIDNKISPESQKTEANRRRGQPLPLGIQNNPHETRSVSKRRRADRDLSSDADPIRPKYSE